MNTVTEDGLDSRTTELVDRIVSPLTKCQQPSQQQKKEISDIYYQACKKNLSDPILELFSRLLDLHIASNIDVTDFGIHRQDIVVLARKHRQLDTQMMPLGVRLAQYQPGASQ